MIITVGPNGEVQLDQLFTKATIDKIYSYSMDTTDTAIVVTFFDVDGKQIHPKLRKRGQAKKA